jgi:peptidoglycan/xylan/chitin deacetylase (PgdA/CDA1 family)
VPAVLERQVRAVLRRRYRPATAAEVAEGRGRTLHVTFDDAYRNTLAVVPLLRRLGVPMTIFACSDFAVDGRPLDIPELAKALDSQPDELRTLTFQELSELIAMGVEIGSHTCSHPHLTRLSDAELSRELRSSRECLEDNLHTECRYFAYPFGEHDARVRSAVAHTGYAAAFALPGPLGARDRYQIPRVGLWRKDGVLSATIKTSVVGQHATRRVRLRARWPRPDQRPELSEQSGEVAHRQP